MKYIRVKCMPLYAIITSKEFEAMTERNRYNVMIIWAHTMNSFVPMDDRIEKSFNIEKVDFDAMKEFVDIFDEPEMRRMVDEAKVSKKRLQRVDDADSIYPFLQFWSDYRKPKDRAKARMCYAQLSEDTRKLIREHLVHYVRTTPDPKYRKSPWRYITHHAWEDGVEASAHPILSQPIILPEITCP